MISVKLGFRSVARRGWGLLLIILPAALLFSMLTFLFATESAVRQLTAPGLHYRSFRLGTVNGIAWEQTKFTHLDVARLATIPGLTPAPGLFTSCYTDSNEPAEFICGFTNDAYIKIWQMDMLVPQEDIDKWNAVRNGVLISRAEANKHNWKVGDHVTLSRSVADPALGKPMDLVVTGISDTYLISNKVYIHSEFYEQHSTKTLDYWVLWALVDHESQRDPIMHSVDQSLSEIHHAHTTWPGELSSEAILGSSKLLRDAFRIAGILSLLLVVFSTVALLVVSVEQRNTELAALLAIGFRRATLARSVIVEGTLMLLPAALLGALAVWFPYHDHPIMFDLIFRVKVGWQDVGAAMLCSAVIGSVTALIPASRVFYLDVLKSLR